MARRELATPLGMMAALTLAVPVSIVAYAGRVAPAAEADQIVGLRFSDLDIPREARIVNAWVEFDADEPTARTAFLTIHARAVDDAPAIAATRGGADLEPLTLTAVEWSPWARLAGAAVGHADRTPDLAPLFQEVVSRPGWSPGNAIVLVFSRSGGQAFEGGRTRAPLLHLEFRRQPPGGSSRVELGRPTRLG